MLKGPQVLVQAAALLRRRRPDIDLKLTILGALSGASDFNLGSLVNAAGMDDVATHLPPVGPPELAGRYRSADVVVRPSHSESFGLVAIRRQAIWAAPQPSRQRGQTGGALPPLHSKLPHAKRRHSARSELLAL